jgi:hypothetical protein
MSDWTPERKMREELARQNYEAPRKPVDNSYINTKIQGVPVTLIKINDRTTAFTFNHNDPGVISQPEFLASYGSQDPDFVYGLITKLANAGAAGECPDAEGLKFALAAVRGMAPRDPLEATLCANMAVIHSSMMMFAHRLAHAEELPEIESAERSLNRLSRTYCGLTEAFDRHRNGDRKIAVRSVVSSVCRRLQFCPRKPTFACPAMTAATGQERKSCHV